MSPVPFVIQPNIGLKHVKWTDKDSNLAAGMEEFSQGIHMARSDLLSNLIKAERDGDRAGFRRTVESIIADERDKNHTVVADRLSGLIEDQNCPPNDQGWDNRLHRLVIERTPERSLASLQLPKVVVENVGELVEEQHRSEVLFANGLEPRHRVMCIGPPGTGKTTLAEAIAFELMVPLYTIRYEGLIGKYLGETNDRLRKVLEFARTRKCVLFFDEFDAIGKERGDDNDAGEVKRVVSSLLMQLDALPSHVVVVVASNHPELLDRAVWRRFQLRLDLPMPTLAQRTAWLEGFRKSLPSPIGMAAKTLAERLGPLSYAELEEFTTDVRRRIVLSGADGRHKAIVQQKLKQWTKRAHIK